MAICCCPYNKHKWEVGQFSSDESFWMCPALSRNSTCIRWGDLSRRQRTQSFFLLLGIVMVVYSLLQDFQTSVGIKLKWGIVERAPSKNFQFSRLLICLRNLLSWLPRCFRCRWSEDYPLRKKTRETGQSTFPCRKQLTHPSTVSQHDGLYPKGGNKKASSALF